MSVKRSIKKSRLQKPPLSKLDKAIYVLIMLISLLIMVGGMVIFMVTIPKAIGFSEKNIVAVNPTESLWVMILIFSFSGMTMIVAAFGIDNKRPIFGNKKFKPSILHPTIKTYPIFSKEFHNNLTDKEKLTIRITLVVLLMLFVANVVLIPFTLYKRNVLSRDNEIFSYNVYNERIQEYKVEDAEKLIIKIVGQGGGWRKPSPDYEISLEFVYSDDSYVFTLDSFGPMLRKEKLNYMLYLKGLFKDATYEIENVELMEKLVSDQRFSESEIKLVYELFDYEGE